MYEKHFIPIGEDQVCLHRFKNEGGTPILLLHGSVENGRIFYTKSGKGLGPFLCENGFDVYVPDMRGKGESTPTIGPGHAHTQTEQIMEDIPAYLAKIEELRPYTSIHFGAHSWGGVLLLSYMARFKDKRVKSMVFFGTKRKIYQKGLKKWFMINVMWDWFGERIAKKNGYLPSVKWKFGSDNEPRRFYQQTNRWVMDDEWVDQLDGFDYKAELQKMNLPPVLYLTGTKDKMLGNHGDVQRLQKETGPHQPTKFLHIGVAQGFKNDYDHINLLTHKDAPSDHFQLALDWYKEND